MSTITALLEADPDGTLYLPVPQNLRCGNHRGLESCKDFQPRMNADAHGF